MAKGRTSFEDRLKNIKVGTDTPALEERPVTRTNMTRANKKKRKTRAQTQSVRQKKPEVTYTGPNSVMLPLGLFLGALSVAAGRLTEFQLFSPEGLGQLTPPMPMLSSYGYFIVGGILALLFTWAFEMDGVLRKLAVFGGFGLMVVYEPMLVEQIPSVYATMYTDNYVAEQLAKVPDLPRIPGLDKLPV